MSERSRGTELAAWVGGQLKSLRGQLPAWRSKTGTTTATLALGTPLDVAVVWDTALPDAAYWCWAQATGTTGATTQVALAIKSQTSTGCVVTIRPALALAAGYTFRVFAVRLPGGAANLG